MIGRNFNDANVQTGMKYWKFKAIEKNGLPECEVMYCGKRESFTPVQVSTMLLSQLKKDAEEFLKSPVHDAVITVPAHFNNGQREATILAAKVAGLKVHRIINEPTAAVLAHSKEHNFKTGNKKVLVYDLGGGTFDITIAECQDAVLEVISTSGDSFLGGRDFDKNLFDLVAPEVEKACGTGFENDNRASMRLLQACNIAKNELSSYTTSTISLENFFNGKNFSTTVSRVRFEKKNEHLFKKTLDYIQAALNEAKLKKEDIDEVLLVGGSTRICRIQNLLKEFFTDDKVINSRTPEETVARGAAIQASLVSMNHPPEMMAVVLIDVCSLSLGVQTKDDKISFIIKRNRPIPCSESKEYVTTVDYQKNIELHIYEGERPIASENFKLDSFKLDGITPGLKGQFKYVVTFTIDVNGILNVKAEERCSGKSEEINITRERRAPEDVQTMIADEKKFEAQDRKELRRLKLKKELEDYLYQVMKNP